MDDFEYIREAQEYAQRAHEFADRGKDNAALSYLTLSMERLCVFIGRREMRREGLL